MQPGPCTRPTMAPQVQPTRMRGGTGQSNHRVCPGWSNRRQQNEVVWAGSPNAISQFPAGCCTMTMRLPHVVYMASKAAAGSHTIFIWSDLRLWRPLKLPKCATTAASPLIIRGRLQSFEATIGCPVHATRALGGNPSIRQSEAAEPPPDSCGRVGWRAGRDSRRNWSRTGAHPHNRQRKQAHHTGCGIGDGHAGHLEPLSLSTGAMSVSIHIQSVHPSLAEPPDVGLLIGHGPASGSATGSPTPASLLRA